MSDRAARDRFRNVEPHGSPPARHEPGYPVPRAAPRRRTVSTRDRLALRRPAAGPVGDESAMSSISWPKGVMRMLHFIGGRPSAQQQLSNRSARASRSVAGRVVPAKLEPGFGSPRRGVRAPSPHRSTRWISGCSNPAESALFPLGPEADATARPGSTRSAGSLIGGGATDPFQLPAVDASLRVVTDRPSQPGVDTSGNPIDRHRGLGDIRAENHLAALARSEGTVLVLGRQRSVERQNHGTCPAGDRARAPWTAGGSRPYRAGRSRCVPCLGSPPGVPPRRV